MSCIEDLREKREELNRSLLRDEEEKAKIQKELSTLTERLSRLNEDIARKMQARVEFDQTVRGIRRRDGCTCMLLEKVPPWQRVDLFFYTGTFILAWPLVSLLPLSNPHPTFLFLPPPHKLSPSPTDPRDRGGVHEDPGVQSNPSQCAEEGECEFDEEEDGHVLKRGGRGGTFSVRD